MSDSSDATAQVNPFEDSSASNRRQQPPQLVIPPTPTRVYQPESPQLHQHHHRRSDSPSSPLSSSFRGAGPATSDGAGGGGGGAGGGLSAPTSPNLVQAANNSNSNRPQRRVQWPAELSNHYSVQMRSSAAPTSPQTLQDLGAQDELQRALEAHRESRSALAGVGSSTPPRYITAAGDYSEPPSRGESTDGDGLEGHDERMHDLRDQMDVFVDPGETDGLPTIGLKEGENEDPDANSRKQAWALVKGYTSGNFGFMRQRKNAGFRSGMGENGDEEDEQEPQRVRDEESRVGNEEKSGNAEDEDEEKKGGGAGAFFKNLLRSDGLTDIPDDRAPPTLSSSGVTGTGVLSALMALQAQQNESASVTTSAATSPSTSRAASIRTSVDSDEETEDEAERIKFIEKLRKKRESKNAFHATSSAVAGAGKEFAKSATKFATSGLHHKRAVSSDGGGITPVSPGAPNHEGHTGHSHSHSSSSAKSPGGTPFTLLKSRSSSHLPPEPPSPGLHNPNMNRKKGFIGETVNQLGKLGRAVGIEHETSNSRPEAARSGAGVFGGLMLSTGNIASIASPTATSLAPEASRPGYHLSRYSAPTIPQVKTPTEGRKSFDMSWARSSSRPSSRPQSLYDSPRETDSPKDSSGGQTPLGSPPLKSGGSTPPATSLKSGKPSFSISLPHHHTPKFPFSHNHSAGESTPRRESHIGDYFFGAGAKKEETQEEREKREWEKEKRRRRKAREKKKAEQVFITQHVAAILARQEFLLKMGRSFMMFGAPSHRLEAQIQATARVLEINCQVIYIPGVMMVSFGDVATHTSEIKFLKQANGLDLGKLLEAYWVYYKVVHDKISVTDASVQLDDLMKAPPKYKLWQHLVIGGLASAAIQPSAFYGSFIDCLVAIPLGSLLVLTQVVVSRNDLYSSLFEIVIACLQSFLAAALASTKHFCFAAVASGSVVLILPGYIVLCGSLELANRSIISGSVRLVYSILYSLFLGFGLGMGAEVYQRITGLSIAGAQDYTCSALRVDAPWYRATIPQKYYILSIPIFLLMLALRNGQPLFRKETPIMILIGASGFTANFFGGKAFPNRSDISSALGSFTVGFLGNVYGKINRSTSPFVVMVVGVLVQLPSGLSASGGLLTFASSDSSSASYSAGFTTAESLVSVAIGLTVGLFLAAAVVNIFGGGRRRGSYLSSF